eukprot:gene10073-7043_t
MNIIIYNSIVLDIYLLLSLLFVAINPIVKKKGKDGHKGTTALRPNWYEVAFIIMCLSRPAPGVPGILQLAVQVRARPPDDWQNELWRNVHEAQFEHLRKVYKRQWLEAFRVNSDEYIHKYNITKAAQMAQWEHEMHAQEKKRVENRHLAQGRQTLKKKHLDLLREFHERQFFYWYERASERLQYMTHPDHIEAELNKYVIGSKEPYRLNFAGQMPMLEDADGNIAQVPQELMVNHTSENPDASATAHATSRYGTSGRAAPAHAGKRAGGASHDAVCLGRRRREAQDAMPAAARSMEETDEDREVSRRAYIDRGKTGSKTIFQ